MCIQSHSLGPGKHAVLHQYSTHCIVVDADCIPKDKQGCSLGKRIDGLGNSIVLCTELRVSCDQVRTASSHDCSGHSPAPCLTESPPVHTPCLSMFETMPQVVVMLHGPLLATLYPQHHPEHRAMEGVEGEQRLQHNPTCCSLFHSCTNQHAQSLLICTRQCT